MAKRKKIIHVGDIYSDRNGILWIATDVDNRAVTDGTYLFTNSVRGQSITNRGQSAVHFASEIRDVYKKTT